MRYYDVNRYGIDGGHVTVHAEQVFGDTYAGLYDEFYEGKDYASECVNLIEVARHSGLLEGERILDVGCGTGRHASVLAEMGFQITGTDVSPSMLAIARSRSSAAFEVADMSSMESRQGEFGLVYSLFDVLSYQISLSDATDFLASLASWAKPGGLVIVDAWHLAGLINDPPVSRSQEFTLHDGRIVERLSSPTINWVEGTTEVRYDLKVMGGAQPLHFTEVHSMRAFTKWELELLAEKVGMEVIGITSSPSLRTKVSDDDWHVGLIARKLDIA